MELRVEKEVDDVIKLLQGINTVDVMVYPVELQGTDANEMKRLKKNTRSFICVYDAEVLVGYITYYPITDDLASAILNDDTIHDDDITAEDIVGYERGKEHTIYILSIAILPEYQGGETMKVLGNAFKREIVQLCEEGFKIKDLLATTVSAGGERAMRGFGLQEVKEINKGYKVYRCNYTEFKKDI